MCITGNARQLVPIQGIKVKYSERTVIRVNSQNGEGTIETSEGDLDVSHGRNIPIYSLPKFRPFPNAHNLLQGKLSICLFKYL